MAIRPYTNGYGRGVQGYRIKKFLRFFNQQSYNKIFIDGKQRNNKIRDTQAIYDFEIKDNNLYIYSKTECGRNRFSIVQITRVEDNIKTRGRKRKVETIVESYPTIEQAKEAIAIKCARKDEIVDNSKRIYDIDYELRYYRTPNDYDVIEYKSELNDLI